MFNAKYIRLLVDHWTIARDESERQCVPGWTSREKEVLRWLYRNNPSFRAIRDQLLRLPVVDESCQYALHVTGVTTRGVHAIINSPDPVGTDEIVFACEAEIRRRGEKIDFTTSFDLKLRLAFPMLFPLGRLPEEDDAVEFLNMTETWLLHDPAYQRLRGHLYGYIFQEPLIAIRNAQMNKEINNHMWDKEFSKGMVTLGEAVFPSGVSAVRRARENAFALTRRLSNGHFFFTATAYMYAIAKLLSLSTAELNELFPNHSEVTPELAAAAAHL